MTDHDRQFAACRPRKLPLLPQSWHRQITICRFGADPTQTTARPSASPRYTKRAATLLSASLRNTEKSACSVSLSGIMAAPTIDLVAEVCGSSAAARPSEPAPQTRMAVRPRLCLSYSAWPLARLRSFADHRFRLSGQYLSVCMATTI